ncbi:MULTISPECIES: hypothetical protein [Thermomonosporaceae]|uniref:hypothetical protein n=1 Tax=Thermomonosporaceae TaxID=2012 RepID=UPI00255B3180|nr:MULTISPECIES: hypothetical protein [Thermomonosporaceae]MDL4772539.1 hypothetical protein [Actinomadura xylanilytica]
MTGTHGWTLHSWAILLHIILFVYWLGGDLGVFYSSRFILKPELSTAARGVAVKIMHVVDMSPRICLVLFLPSGITLMASDDLGRDMFGGRRLAAIWIFALVWLWLVIADYRRGPGRFGDAVHRTDLIVRGALIAVLLGGAAYTFVADEPFGVTSDPRWLAGKVAAYALCIAGGLAIRVKLKPFGAAWGTLLAKGSSPEVERDIRGAVQGSIPYVLAIWVLVVVAALLGVVKPGTTAY